MVLAIMLGVLTDQSTKLLMKLEVLGATTQILMYSFQIFSPASQTKISVAALEIAMINVNHHSCRAINLEKIVWQAALLVTGALTASLYVRNMLTLCFLRISILKDHHIES